MRITLLCLLLLALPAGATDLAITHARIITAPDAAPIDDATVLIDDGRIAAVGPAAGIAIPADARRIDGSGKTVVAGYWNSHVHLLSPILRDAPGRPAAELDTALRDTFTSRGFTTVFDLASFNGNAASLARRIKGGEVVGPRVLHVGAPFVPMGGTPVYIRQFVKAVAAPSAEVATAGAARARARRQLRDGADGVKLFTGSIVGGDVGVLPMRPDIARAIVDTAHRAGKPAFAHPSDLAGLQVALDSGVDVLAHTTPMAGPWDAALVQRMRTAGVALVPTLTLFEVELAREQLPPDVVERVLGVAVGQLAAFAAAGGLVLFGTDVDYIDRPDTHREFALMARAGMDWRAILASLTTVPAQRFDGTRSRGTIIAGEPADLVLLANDPSRDIAAFSDVDMTIRDGKVVYTRP